MGIRNQGATTRYARRIVETGRVINRRYLLQRLVKQGQVCAIYQGTDQVLQRLVAIKAVPAPHILTYKAAIKMTAHFSHPNVVGIYDLVIEPEMLYIVQEYIDGINFSGLLQTQLSFYEVAGIGMQICQALIYADNSSRRVSHGDLAPSSIMRDTRWLVRVNNFALPSDLGYFQSCSIMGGDAIAISAMTLPYGHQSEERRADDTRASALLLYQLLTARAPGSIVVEPPPDGLLRFQRNTPPELCEALPLTVVRQHPQRIRTPHTLHAHFKPISEKLVQPTPVVMPV